MICNNCGTQLGDDARFCDACGTQTSSEQARIEAESERKRQENPPAFLDVKTALIITVALFIILPIPCLFADVPLILGFATAGVMSAILIIFGVRNQRKFKQ